MLISKYRLFFLEVGRIVRDINTNFEINIEMVIESIEQMKFLRVDTAKKKKREREKKERAQGILLTPESCGED